MEIILDQKHAMARLRAYRMDTRHPIQRRLFRARTFPSNTRLLRSRLLQLEGLELVDLLAWPPWQIKWDCKQQSICSIKGAGVAFQQWADSQPPLSMFLFTDGSQLNTTAGAGWYGHWGAWKQESARGHLTLPQHEVFDAEAVAATEGLKDAFKSTQAPYTQNLYILLDNQEAARQLQGYPRGSSQSVIQAFQKAADTWPSRPTRCRAIPPGQVLVHWIPGHAGTAGNEQADAQAKKGAGFSISLTNPHPARLAWAQRTLKESFWQRFETYWTENAPQQYKDLSIRLDRRPHELSLPRATLGRLLAARSGHGDFAQYHERFGHEDTMIECSCGLPKTPLHFYYCQKGHKASPHPWGNQQVDEILRSKAGTRDFHEWLQRSHFYRIICPAH